MEKLRLVLVQTVAINAGEDEQTQKDYPRFLNLAHNKVNNKWLVYEYDSLHKKTTLYGVWSLLYHAAKQYEKMRNYLRIPIVYVEYPYSEVEESFEI